jgi:hypothetical protein
MEDSIQVPGYPDNWAARARFPWENWLQDGDDDRFLGNAVHHPVEAGERIRFAAKANSAQKQRVRVSFLHGAQHEITPNLSAGENWYQFCRREPQDHQVIYVIEAFSGVQGDGGFSLSKLRLIKRNHEEGHGVRSDWFGADNIQGRGDYDDLVIKLFRVGG